MAALASICWRVPEKHFTTIEQITTVRRALHTEELGSDSAGLIADRYIEEIPEYTYEVSCKFQGHQIFKHHYRTVIMGDAPIFRVSNPFRDRIIDGQVCSVMSCKFFVGNEVAMMAKMANIDGMFIDMEHSTLTIQQVSQLTLACNFVGVSPLVRIPSKSHWHLSRILDAGAAGVIIPHCETVEEVKAIVRDAKYGPIGRRGCANNQPILNFESIPTLVQNDLLNRETMVIPMIETPGAVELADEFLAIEGVDGILIGSNDLCTDLGIPGQYDNTTYQDAVTKIVLAGKKARKPIGIGGIGGRLDLLEKWFTMGAT